MEYRRVYVKGGTYFFTLVTHKRRPLFASQKSIELLNDAIRYTSSRMAFDIVANVILPDHLHIIWTLPDDSSDFSTRWRLIKSHFTRDFLKGEANSKSMSRVQKGEQDVWQRRFWEHLIRDEDDLTCHIEYIHYNPVKHGLVNSPIEWKNSSFYSYVQDGLYSEEWGNNSNIWSGTDHME